MIVVVGIDKLGNNQPQLGAQMITPPCNIHQGNVSLIYFMKALLKEKKVGEESPFYPGHGSSDSSFDSQA